MMPAQVGIMDQSQTSKLKNSIETNIKSTETKTGQNPEWNETFSFNYQRISKNGLKILNNGSKN